MKILGQAWAARGSARPLVPTTETRLRWKRIAELLPPIRIAGALTMPRTSRPCGRDAMRRVIPWPAQGWSGVKPTGLFNLARDGHEVEVFPSSGDPAEGAKRGQRRPAPLPGDSVVWATAAGRPLTLRSVAARTRGPAGINPSDGSAGWPLVPWGVRFPCASASCRARNSGQRCGGGRTRSARFSPGRDQGGLIDADGVRFDLTAARHGVPLWRRAKPGRRRAGRPGGKLREAGRRCTPLG